MMIIPEFREIIEKPLNIIKHNQTDRAKGIKIGEQNCNHESIAYTSFRGPIPICPWHWTLIEREDKFPFKRANAQCNCQSCQAKTIYDSNLKRFSSCNNQFVLMPMLWRVAILNMTETWTFHLEEVPVSCVCSMFRS
jgi:hypothetical protein